jgi:RNA-binding protein
VSELTPKERRGLRARAHHLQPVVMIGDAGLTEQVIREIEANLRSHELIKIRAGEDRAARDALVSAICAATGAHSVQQIGKIVVIYRPEPAGQQNNAIRPAHSTAEDETEFPRAVNGKR